jgi:serine/threonine protein phosphatase PrpC
VKPVNQDACVATPDGIVVADGIGSFYQAEVAAQLVSQELAKRLDKLPHYASPEDYTLAFKQVELSLRQSEAAKNLVVPDTHPATDVLGTTLLCAKAEGNRLTVAYVGNGAILHLRGGFSEFPANVLLPWNALNYLNPHTIAHDGRNMLVRFMSPAGSEAQSQPTVLQLQQDITDTGDILILCTDGIHSNDQVPVGRDEEGNLWISGEQALKRLYQALSTYLRETEPTSDGLRQLLERYLEELEQAKMISDDCTVAVLITNQALKHFQRLRTTLYAAPTAYAAD